MKQLVKKYINKIGLESSARFLLIATALTPLMRTNFSLFPYVFGKAFYFSVLVALAAVCIGIGVLRSPMEWRQKWHVRFGSLRSNKILLFVVLYFVSMGVSTIFSKNPYVSFWGTMDRLDGFVHLSLYAVSAVFAGIIFEKKHWERYAYLSMVTVIVLGVVAWLERIGVTIPLPITLNPSSQPGSLIGSSTFLASYLLVASIYISTQIGISDIKRMYWKTAYILFYLFLFATIILTGTKGAFLGLCAAVITYTCSIVVGKKSSPVMRIGAVSILVSGVVFVGLFMATRDNPFWLKIPTITRFVHLNSNSNSVQSRVLSWDAAVQGIRERWFIGWGNEEFERVFNTYGSPKMGRYTDGWFDRAHNKYLDLLVNQGLLGFTLYVVIIAAMVASLRNTPAAMSLFVAYLVHNFFIFDTIVSYPIFFLLAIFSASRHGSTFRTIYRGGNWARILAVILMVCAIYILILNSITLRQQLAFDALVKSRSPEARQQQLSAILYPSNYTQTKVRMQLLEFFVTALKPRNPTDIDSFITATHAMEEILLKGDGDPRYAVDLAQSYYYLRGIDPTYANKAQDYAQSVLEQTPTAPKGYYLFTLMSLDSRRFELAIEYARKAAALDDGNARAQLQLATTLIAAGDKDSNPFYYAADDKFNNWLKEGRTVLGKSYDLSFRRRDGVVAESDDDFRDTQFQLLSAREIQTMYEFALKFNEISMSEKIKRAARSFEIEVE